jgi:hypothetical protein
MAETSSIAVRDERYGTRFAKLLVGGIFAQGKFVVNAAELTQEKNISPSFIDIFNNWKRINTNPANNEHLQWQIENGLIVSTINSTSLIGFISSEKYDTYDHTATLKSTGGDDDMIALVIAATEINGELFTLIAVRSSNNTSNSKYEWSLVYNFNAPNARVLVNGNSLTPNANCNWDAVPNGTRVRIERNGDLITAKCSHFNTTNIVDSTLLTLNLNSHPDLHKFKGPCSYGYACYSQTASSFSEITFITDDILIFDVTNDESWNKEGDNWILKPEYKFSTFIGYEKFIYNPRTKKLYFAEGPGKIIPILLQ